jgi:molybdopterin/thiamine biosynthesis adenylyltransferase
MLAQKENILSLMGLLGGTEEGASQKLATRVALTVDNGAQLLANDVSALLGRSLLVVEDTSPDIELALGTTFRTRASERIHVGLNAETLTISRGGAGGVVTRDAPGLFRKIASCYTAGNVIARAVGGERFASLPDPFIVNFSAFGVSPKAIGRKITLDDAVLVGAGGVGNGFMWAAQELDLTGRLIIADPKRISAGGLNRCLFFREEDIGNDKAAILAVRTSRPGFEVTAFGGEFGRLVAERKRVRRVFSTPDSREVRRSIQGELPLEVLDASTTDSTAVVVHSHRQPTDRACLACIYPHIPIEDQRRIHIAEGLGLSVDVVRRGFIDEEVARKLAALHPNLDEAALLGKAFDTVYKEQCGQDVLLTAAGKQAVAPLAFISNLAGALLALELVRYDAPPLIKGSTYMTLDPWRPPTAHARRNPARNPECEFCASGRGLPAMRAVWPEMDWSAL